MSKKNKDFSSSFPFFEALKEFYLENKGKIRRNYKSITKKYLDYNDIEINPNAFLRKPQFEALEMYVFLKEFMDNKQHFVIRHNYKYFHNNHNYYFYHKIFYHGYFHQ